MSVIAELGRFSVQPDLGVANTPVRHEAKRSILNFIGAALGAASDPAVTVALEVHQALSVSSDAQIIGRAERLDFTRAAAVNAIAGNLHDFDDTHLPTVIHPSACVVPIVLSLGEKERCSGQAIVDAFIVGAEIECRIGNAVSPGHYARGWHITTTCGVFGAAAAAARLLGLDAQGAGNALGIAAGLASGIVENLAVSAKNVSIGNAARNGIEACLFAGKGFNSAPTALEGALGWARAAGDELNLDEAVAALGTRWEAARNTYKPYPCGIVMHSVIDACLQIRAHADFDLNLIESITVSGDALLMARGDRAVNNPRDARVSTAHCAVASLLWGTPGLAEFDADKVFAEGAVELRRKVNTSLDPSLPAGASSVELKLTNGQVLRSKVLAAHGSEHEPLSDGEIEHKLEKLVDYGNVAVDPRAICDAVWQLDSAPSLAALTRAITP